MEKIVDPHFINRGLQLFGIFVRATLSLRYKVQMNDPSCLLSDPRPKLFMPNHQALIDPVILVAHLYKTQPVYPFIIEDYFKIPGVGRLFKALDARKVPNAIHARKNPNYLSELVAELLHILSQEKNVLLYPSGSLTNDGIEHIKGQKLGWEICSKLPTNVLVIGVKGNGLWGSSFSKYKTGKTPSLVNTIVKNIVYAILRGLFFMPRRNVNFTFENITKDILSKQNGEKNEFNSYLENFYSKN